MTKKFLLIILCFAALCLRSSAVSPIQGSSSSGGTGTVTATGGNLTSNAVVLGAGTVDTKVVIGITTDGTAKLILGVNTTTLGAIKLFGSTSGDVTIQPNVVAGTSTVLTLPATTGTFALVDSQAFTGTPTAPTPTTGDNSTTLATTAFVQNSVTQTFDEKPAVSYVSLSALPANTYSNGSSGVGATLTGSSNGPIVIDGVTIPVGGVGLRVLITAEAAPANNGWYTITTVGVVAVSKYVLTRATESDQAAEIGAGYITSVTAGNTITAGANNGKAFISVAADPFTVGTTSLTFSQVGGTYAAGNGISLSGSTFSIDTTITADLTTSQTLTNKTLTAAALGSSTATTQSASDNSTKVSTTAYVDRQIDSNAAKNHGGWTEVYVSGSDFTTTNTTLTTITGLTTGTLSASTLYEVEAVMRFANAADSTGMQWGWTAGGTGTAASGTMNGQMTGSSINTSTSTGNGVDHASTACVNASGVEGTVVVKGLLTTRSTGTPTFSMQCLKVTSNTATVRVGSVLRYRLAGQ